MIYKRFHYKNRKNGVGPITGKTGSDQSKRHKSRELAQKVAKKRPYNRILFKFHGNITCYDYLDLRARRREVKSTLLL